MHQINITRVLQTLLFISVVAGIIAGYNRYGLWGWDIAPDWLVKAGFCHHGMRQIDGFRDAFLIASAIAGGIAIATVVFMSVVRTRVHIHLRYTAVIVLIPVVLSTMDIYLKSGAMSISNAVSRAPDHRAAGAVHKAVCRPLEG